jgi:predicted pyridoxine 5'-phosphate oxidase superfamily flavin-nucleotide-binding protein
MPRAFAEIAFTPAVRAVQARQGSAAAYDRALAPETDPANRIGESEAAFIEARDGFYQATVSQTGWPYVQFRGGPPGFLKVLDAETIGYADFRGNRQYLSAGNLGADDRVSLILMDYANRRRLKVLGHARLIEAADDPALVARLHVEGYKARPERAVLITVAGLDWNCSQHIPVRLTRAELEPHLAPLRAELARLQAENAELKTWRGATG